VLFCAVPCCAVPLQVWTAERSTQLGMAVSSMLKGYTTTAAQIITAMLKSVTKFTIQVCFIPAYRMHVSLEGE
jgi:hypothetical protein